MNLELLMNVWISFVSIAAVLAIGEMIFSSMLTSMFLLQQPFELWEKFQKAASFCSIGKWVALGCSIPAMFYLMTSAT